MSKFEFGKFETEIDVTDVAFVEKYEAMIEQYNADIENLPKDEKASAMLLAMCNTFFKAFDSLFGDGTHQKMFGERKSVDLCADAFRKLIQVAKDFSPTVDKMEALSANREQRRAKK